MPHFSGKNIFIFIKEKGFYFEINAAYDFKADLVQNTEKVKIILKECLRYPTISSYVADLGNKLKFQNNQMDFIS